MLLFALALLSAAGCTKKPTLKINHAEVSGVRLGLPPSLGVVMTVVVDVHNPNSYDVAIRAMRGQCVMAERYTLPVDFQAPGEGVWLTADATTPLRVPVTIPVELAVSLVREAYTTPQIPYRFTGKADVTATRTFKVEKDDYSLDERGSITREQVEAAMRLGF
jgi:hypothetical protein